jgi:hypothetical protein
MTSRSDISKQLELKWAARKEKLEDARKEKKARKLSRMKSYGSPGPGMDFPAPGSDPNVKHYRKRRTKKRKGGKIMVGYKAGGKV